MLQSVCCSWKRKFIVSSVSALLAVGAHAQAGTPDLGPNVVVFDPAMPATEMQSKIDEIYTKQHHSEFGDGRYAILLRPGAYKLDIPVGFYTQVLGLGASPDDTRVVGNVHSDAAFANNNATTTFWRAVEGFSVTPTGGTMQWAVSQGVAFRRMHVLGDLVLHQHGGWASGGWISDSEIDGNVGSGSQQQWISRNSEWKSWTGTNWNMVFVGVKGAPASTWPKPAYTTVAQSPVVREKPFLQLNAKGAWSVRVPSLARNASGYTWHSGTTPGFDIPLSRFYIAHPEKDTAASLNKALATGGNLIFTPGTYELTEPLRVTRKGSVVIGLGFATLRPVNGNAAMEVADVDGASISGILFDAGLKLSPVLLQVGASQHTSLRHVANPVSVHDVWFREGGAAAGSVETNLLVNSNDAIVDDTWIWRADHGHGVGWDTNLSRNGIVVNGDDVTAYGLFVEHHQQFQTVWNGERGRTYFYQSEIPYDPPTQSVWTSAPSLNGWASYKVGDSVKQHEAWGLGVYSVFRHPDVILTHAIEAPQQPAVRFHHMVTVALDDKGRIDHIINDTGAPATTEKPRVDPRLAEYPAP